MKKKLLICINFDEGLYNFRRELIETLLLEGYEIHLAMPYGEYTERLKQLGCFFHDTALERRGKNPLKELALLKRYREILKQVQPLLVLSYTIKPNIYMGFACAKEDIPFIPTVTGLGTAVEGKGLLQHITQQLYRLALKKASLVFFQNETNEMLFSELKIAPNRHEMLPGSGVNLEHFKTIPFENTKTPTFIFISRIMKEKGIDELLKAAEQIKKINRRVRFIVLGFLEADYEGRENFERCCKEGIIEFKGSVEDVRPYIGESVALIHPSWYPEGMSNVCQEAAACGRAVITTERAGCRETVIPDESGFIIPERDSEALVKAIERFLSLSTDKQERMGLKGRQYMETRFDRKIVVQHYINAINRFIK